MFRNKILERITLYLFSVVLLSSCKKTDYTRLVEQELKKGRQDSLFLGLHFGMKRQVFFDQCMELNRQHLTINGMKGLSVLYKIQDPEGTIYMHFYPEFWEDRIYEMRVVFTYENWSLSNPNTQPDSLQNTVKRMYDQWYGPGFLAVKKDMGDHQGDLAYVKVNGNRRIVVFKEGEMDVRAVFTDLIKENEIKK